MSDRDIWIWDSSLENQHFQLTHFKSQTMKYRTQMQESARFWEQYGHKASSGVKWELATHSSSMIVLETWCHAGPGSVNRVSWFKWIMIHDQSTWLYHVTDIVNLATRLWLVTVTWRQGCPGPTQSLVSHFTTPWTWSSSWSHSTSTPDSSRRVGGSG